MQIKNEVLHVDTIDVVSEQLIWFIMREILDPKGEFYHDGPINRVASASTSWGLRTCNRDICIFVNIIMSR
jgi:hypothetical protein